MPNRSEAQAIVEVGRDLIAVKAALGHGHFLAWIEAEFEMSPDKAQKIMNVARRFWEMPHVAAFPALVLHELAAPSTPPEVREAVVERAAASEKVTAEPAWVDTQRRLALASRCFGTAPNFRGAPICATA